MLTNVIQDLIRMLIQIAYILFKLRNEIQKLNQKLKGLLGGFTLHQVLSVGRLVKSFKLGSGIQMLNQKLQGIITTSYILSNFFSGEAAQIF